MPRFRLCLAAFAAVLLVLSACTSNDPPPPEVDPTAPPEVTATQAPPAGTPTATATPEVIGCRRVVEDLGQLPAGTEFVRGGIVGAGDFTAGKNRYWSNRAALDYWGGNAFERDFAGGTSAGRVLDDPRFGDTRWPDLCLGVESPHADCPELEIAAATCFLSAGTGANYYEFRVADGIPTWVAWLPERVIEGTLEALDDERVVVRTRLGRLVATRIPGTAIQRGLTLGDLVAAAIVPPPEEDGAVLLSLARVGEPSEPVVVVALASKRAIDAVLYWLGLKETSIEVESFESMTWPDGCRGIERRRVTCTKLPREGLRLTVVVRANTSEFRYLVHTDLDGRDPVWATPEAGRWFRLGPCCDTSRDTLLIEEGDGYVLKPWRALFPGTAYSGPTLGFYRGLSYGEWAFVRLAPDPDGEGSVSVSLDSVPRRVREQYAHDLEGIDPTPPAAGTAFLAGGVVATLPPSKANVGPVGLDVWRDAVHAALYWALFNSAYDEGFADFPATRTWPDNCLGVASPTEPCEPGAIAAFEQLFRAGEGPTVYRFRISDTFPVRMAWVPDFVVEGELLTLDGREVRMRSDDGEIFEMQAIEGVQFGEPPHLGAQISEGLAVGDRVRAALVPTPDGSGQLMLSLGPAD